MSTPIVNKDIQLIILNVPQRQVQSQIASLANSTKQRRIMVGGIKVPQRFPCLSQFKEPVSVNLYDKRNFTDVIQPRIWR